VGKADPATGGLDSTTSEVTKASEGGAGDARLSDGAMIVQPNPPRLRREADPVLGRLDLATAPRDTRSRGGSNCSSLTLGCDSWANSTLARSCSLGVGGSILTFAPAPSPSYTGGAASAAGEFDTSSDTSASGGGGEMGPIQDERGEVEATGHERGGSSSGRVGSNDDRSREGWIR
jgi:hypothetical protein